MFQTKVVEKIKTHNLCSITFLENLTLYEIKWKSIVEPERPQMTLWRMCIASCVPKATDTHSEYVTLTAFPLQQRLQESASLLRLTYIAGLFFKYPFNPSVPGSFQRTFIFQVFPPEPCMNFCSHPYVPHAQPS